MCHSTGQIEEDTHREDRYLYDTEFENILRDSTLHSTCTRTRIMLGRSVDSIAVYLANGNNNIVLRYLYVV